MTPRQEEIYRFIRLRSEHSRLPPTVREIGERFQISSTNGVRSILAALIKKGYIRRSPRLSRGIEIVGTADQEANYGFENDFSADTTMPTSDTSLTKTRGPEIASANETDSGVEIPILGRIAAGSPIMAVQNLEGTITVDRDFVARQPNVFALRVRGDSMIGAGILDGDLIFARQQSHAEKGQIIVAQVDDEATVKYYHPQTDRIELHSANPKYDPIQVTAQKQFSIAGRVIGVMRRIN